MVMLLPHQNGGQGAHHSRRGEVPSKLIENARDELDRHDDQYGRKIEPADNDKRQPPADAVKNRTPWRCARSGRLDYKGLD